MSWTKLSDDFADDCWSLSDQAFRLHVEALTWSNRKLLDLRISKADVRRFAKHPDAVKELLQVGWWTEDADHYVIRHHAMYQRPREDVIRQQEANVVNGRKGGRPPRKPREIVTPRITTEETQSVSDSVSEPLSEAVTPSWAPDPQPDSPRAQETHSLSESPRESLTERDRPGQAQGLEDLHSHENEQKTTWPTVVPPGSGRRCRVCRERLDPSVHEDTHPTCDAQADVRRSA